MSSSPKQLYVAFSVGTNRFQANQKLMKKIPGGSEAANIMVGKVDFLTEPLLVFIRLQSSSVLADLTEVAVPTRFLFVALGPSDATSVWEYEEVGRAMAALLTDRVRHTLAATVLNTSTIIIIVFKTHWSTNYFPLKCTLQ